jgi:hypothetical protein
MILIKAIIVIGVIYLLELARQKDTNKVDNVMWFINGIMFMTILFNTLNIFVSQVGIDTYLKIVKFI